MSAVRCAWPTWTCDARPIRADVIEPAVLAHLDRFVGDVAVWIRGRAAEHHHERDRLAAGLDAERAAVAESVRQRDLVIASYRRLLAQGKDAHADLALGEAARIDTERVALVAAVEVAEARLAEFEAEPVADAALDYYNELAEFVRGRLKSARGAAEVNGALHDLLEAAPADMNDRGVLSVEFVLKDSDAVLAGDAPKTVRVSRKDAPVIGPPVELQSEEDLDALAAAIDRRLAKLGG